MSLAAGREEASRLIPPPLRFDASLPAGHTSRCFGATALGLKAQTSTVMMLTPIMMPTRPLHRRAMEVGGPALTIVTR